MAKPLKELLENDELIELEETTILLDKNLPLVDILARRLRKLDEVVKGAEKQQDTAVWTHTLRRILDGENID